MKKSSQGIGCARVVGLSRPGRLKGIAEQLTYRLDAIERAIADLRRDTNARFDSLTRWLGYQ